jgi:hypothetical protein
MAKVPGTYLHQPPTPKRTTTAAGREHEAVMLAAGALHAEAWSIGECTIMVGRERLKGEYRWHLSIAHPSRYPTYDEMKAAIFGIPSLAQVTLAQVIAPGRTGPWVNIHPTCLHWVEIHDPIVSRS